MEEHLLGEINNLNASPYVTELVSILGLEETLGIKEMHYKMNGHC